MAEPLIMNRYNIKTDTYKNFVAVLISPGWGAGWSTWNCPEMAYDERLTSAWYAYEAKGQDVDLEVFEKLVKELYPEAYLGGMNDLILQWIPCGSKFTIDEYDGHESIQFAHEMRWFYFEVRETSDAI